MSDEWRKLGDRIRNWGRWGRDDQLGTLNLITPEIRARAAKLAKTGKVFSLAIPLNGDSPMGAHGLRRPPVHLMAVDGGDENLATRVTDWRDARQQEVGPVYETAPFRTNDDWIFMAVQSSTQWDALCHAYYDGTMYNGVPAGASTSFGVMRDAIDVVADVAPVAGRGVLLDAARHRGVASLEAGTVVQPEELDDIATAQGVTLRQGDIVVVRTGWWPKYAEYGVGNGPAWQADGPGLGWRTAGWLFDHDVAAIASDNVAVEPAVPREGIVLPLHMLTLRDMGLMLGELWDLERLAADCAEDGVYEFFLSAPPLKITGGTGSPINPIAMK